MRFIDVKVRLPKAKLGDFLENLPLWSAQMVGYDLLATAEDVADEPKKKKKQWKAKPNPNYKPKQHSAGDVVLRMLAKGPLTRGDIMAAYKGKFNDAALQSGLYGLRDHGLIHKNGDDKYEVVSG
jgi:hypothetical protein